jgi:hypothetical protein
MAMASFQRRRRIPQIGINSNDLPVLDVTTDVGRTFGALRAALLDAGRAMVYP